jgi:hypothetical protein
MNWAIEHVPSLNHSPQPPRLPADRRSNVSLRAHGSRNAGRQACAVATSGTKAASEQHRPYKECIHSPVSDQPQ